MEEKYIFHLDLWGYKVKVKFEPHWMDHLMHLEFTSEPYEYEKTPNPLSETGYFSHFIMGTPEENGITEENMMSEAQALAIHIAKDRNNKIYQDALIGQGRLL